MRDRITAWVESSSCEPDSHKLPARGWREEIAIRRANVRSGRSAGTSAQHHLVTHELSVVLAESTGERGESRIGRIGTGGPLPDVAEELRDVRIGLGGLWLQGPALEEISVKRQVASSELPLEFGWQSRACPARIGIGFVIADVPNRLVQ